MNYEQAIIKHPLTSDKTITEEWVEWDNEQIDNFLENHMIHDLSWDIVDLWDCIETLAYDFIEMWNTFRLGYNITEE